MLDLYICPSDPSSKTLNGPPNNVLYPNWCWEYSSSCPRDDIAITTYKAINGRGWDLTQAQEPVPAAMYDRRMGYLRQPSDSPFNRVIAIKDVLDGTSNVLMVGEHSPAWQAWGTWASWLSPLATEYPINSALHIYGSPSNRVAQTHGWRNGLSASSFHPGGAQFALADGSVHFVSDAINFATYQQLADPDDGLPASGYSP